MTEVTGTEYTIRDINGKALCHAPSARKSSLDSARKRAALALFTVMCDAAGMVASDGDVWQCGVTGVWAPRNRPGIDAELVKRGKVIDAGHVVSDESDGAFCPCNLVPELRMSNLTHGARAMTGIEHDPRVMWRKVWEVSAKPSKVARAV